MYGTSAGVAALTPRYASELYGDFAAEDRPSRTQVETFLTQVSNLLDVILADARFDTPVTDTEVVSMLTMFVQDEVASIAEGINGSGRFGPTTKGPQKSRYQMILTDIQTFVDETATGLENMGASRTGTLPVLYRGTDESGETPTPIFQRKDFGEEYHDNL